MRMIQHEKKPHAQIVRVLNKLHSNETSLQQINVIHSLLGALRNFCVAGKRKFYKDFTPRFH
jgi:hypothetical protein